LQAGGIKLSYDIQDAAPSAEDVETPDVTVKFTGPDVELLLSNRAELLLALEHVTMEMLRMPSEDHSRISFDANDYRLLRIEELRLSALAAAERVARTGVPFRFNPMNSRERRVIHIALRNETAIRSESGGTGPGRHVVVYPAGMASLPDPPYVPEAPRRTLDSPPREPMTRDARGGRGDRGGRGRSGPPRGGRDRGPRR
jgi:spoIIIJ-associated protein